MATSPKAATTPVGKQRTPGSASKKATGATMVTGSVMVVQGGKKGLKRQLEEMVNVDDESGSEEEEESESEEIQAPPGISH